LSAPDKSHAGAGPEAGRGEQSKVVRGKGDRERSVLITDSARAAVDEYLAARDDDAPGWFVGHQPGLSRGTRKTTK
jgi:site-specific recombinase XerC